MTALNRLLAVLLMLIGGGLVWLGTQLIMAGGSLYYAPTGLALIATALLLWIQSSRALTVFGGLWTITLLWAIWESGLNGWALAARLALLSGIGLWLLMPWVRRSLKAAPTTPLSRSLIALATLGLVTGTGWILWSDRISGGTDIARLDGAPADTRAGEWHSYGNTVGGTRHSPLSQINLSNVGRLERA